MKILFIGDIIGAPGRLAVREILPQIKKDNDIRFTIANIENSAGGFGVTPQILNELFSYGIDVGTSGNHIWDKKEIMQIIDSERRLLRPANYPDGVGGFGSNVFTTNEGYKIGVLNLEGRVYMSNLNCPFNVGKAEVKKLKEKTNIIVVDFHAEVTSEKIALGWYLDGEVSAVIGTHTHIQTADEKILTNGTAYITDVGMTGPYDSVIGVKKELALRRFLFQTPVKFDVANEKIKICAVIVDIEVNSGKATSIQRISIDKD
ncbi:MAG: TIGR00282 family metallophosphoesterase [Candidatus Firestonebacteria bacterium]